MKKSHPFRDILTTKYKVRPVRELLSDGKRRRILDVGCGSAFMLSQLEDEFECGYGIDLERKALRFGKQLTRSILINANAEKLPFANNSFDCVIATDAFEHIPNDNKAMNEVRRVLRPNGIMVVYVPSLSGLLSHLPTAHLYHDSDKSYMLDQRYYTFKSLRRLVEQAGLTVEYIGYHNVFFQEFFTQTLKLLSSLAGKKYSHQAHIVRFTETPWFFFYKKILLPLFTIFIRAEEIIVENLLNARVPGHRVVIKARKYAKLQNF